MPSRQCCAAASLWCGSGVRIWIRLITLMRIRILIFIWCGSGFLIFIWSASGFSLGADAETDEDQGHHNDADPCGSGSWSGSTTLRADLCEPKQQFSHLLILITVHFFIYKYLAKFLFEMETISVVVFYVGSTKSDPWVPFLTAETRSNPFLTLWVHWLSSLSFRSRNAFQGLKNRDS